MEKYLCMEQKFDDDRRLKGCILIIGTGGVGNTVIAKLLAEMESLISNVKKTQKKPKAAKSKAGAFQPRIGIICYHAIHAQVKVSAQKKETANIRVSAATDGEGAVSACLCGGTGSDANAVVMPTDRDFTSERNINDCQTDKANAQSNTNRRITHANRLGGVTKHSNGKNGNAIAITISGLFSDQSRIRRRCIAVEDGFALTVNGRCA